MSKININLVGENIPAFRWLRLASLKYARIGAVADLLNDGKVLVQGGIYYDYSDRNKKIFPPPEILDIQTNSWSDGTNAAKEFVFKFSQPDYSKKPSYGRLYAAITPLPDGQILLTGGYEEGADGPFENSQSNSNAVIINPITGFQSFAGKLCVARHFHASIRLTNGAVILIGGAQGDRGAIADVEIGLPNNWSVEWFSSTLIDDFEKQLKH